MAASRLQLGIIIVIIIMPTIVIVVVVVVVVVVLVKDVVLTFADPRAWTKTHVLQWLNWAIHEFSLENVVRSQFCLSGARLLQLSRDEFLRRAPPFVGDILYEHLAILQKGRLY